MCFIGGRVYQSADEHSCDGGTNRDQDAEVAQLLGDLVGGGKRLVRDDGSCRQLRLVDRQATTTGAITSLALAAVDTALWDVACQRASLPLWRLAGGFRRPGGIDTAACPEHSSDEYLITEEAAAILESFIEQNPPSGEDATRDV